MKIKKMLPIINIFLVLPLTINTMQLTKQLTKKTIVKRHFCNHINDFKSLNEDLTKSLKLLNEDITKSLIKGIKRHMAFAPTLDINVVSRQIKELKQCGNCNIAPLIADAVYMATKCKQYGEKYEEKYAKIIKQIVNCYSSVYCPRTILHTSVISNLSYVTQALLEYDSTLVQAQDFNECIPLHYAQSLKIAKSLLNYKSNVNAKNKWGNTPLHTVPADIVPLLVEHGADVLAKNDLYLCIPGIDWPELAPSYRAINNSEMHHGFCKITPFHEAIDCGDTYKLEKLLEFLTFNKIFNMTSYEELARELLSLALLRYWRTNDLQFLACHNVVLSFLNKRRSSYEENVS